MRSLLFLSALTLASAALAADSKPEYRKVAEGYLNALTGTGIEENRDLLLGGATMTAKMFSLENWRIVSEDPGKSEQGDLASAQQMMNDLDKAGRAALTKLLNMSGGVGNDVTMTEISAEDAAKLGAPTRERANKFLKADPVLAYVARVGKDVYWHPKNPVRPMLASAGSKGKYSLEFHYLHVETKEGPRQVPRSWPLRVLRFKTDTVDTGWKILPASDWNGE